MVNLIDDHGCILQYYKNSYYALFIAKKDTTFRHVGSFDIMVELRSNENVLLTYFNLDV